MTASLVPGLDAATLLPDRAALLDVLSLRRPVAGSVPTSGLVVVGLCPADGSPGPDLQAPDLPMAAGRLVAAGAALSGALLPGDWLARCGPTDFAVVVGCDLAAAATRLLAAVAVPAAAGVFPVTRDRRPDDVLRLAALGLTLARLDGPGSVVRYPVA